MKDHKVCVYAICKNEIGFLDQWLASMSEADYIVVLDTGSTDGSYEYLQNDPRCTKVEQKIINPWRFDTARNESLKLAPKDTDIFVCTDPDELFNLGWCKILKDKWEDGVQRGLYAYAWNHDESGQPLNVFKYDKIHSKGYHWKYPVHEVLWEDDLTGEQQKVIDFGEDIYLHHWQDVSKDRKSYMDLLKLAVDENLQDCHIYHLYAREYLLSQEYESGRQHLLKLLVMPNIDAEIFRQEKLDAILMLADLARMNNQLDESLYWCTEFVKIDNTFREPYLIAANIHCINGNPYGAKQVLDTMREKCYRHYSWVEKDANWSYTEWAIESDIAFAQQRYQDSLEFINICLQHEPNNIDFLRRKISCLEFK